MKTREFDVEGLLVNMAYGNAVVPQVAYEIFRAIETAENEKTV